MTRLFIFFFLCFITSTFAQKKITTINVSDEILHATIDRVGELYVTTKNGQLQKFDINGKLLAVYKNGPVPTLFEPRDGSRLFAFFRKSRKIEYLNPSFEVSSSMLIDSAFVIEPWLACSSGDHNIWTLDAGDQTLKKINPKTSTMEVEVKLSEDVFPDLKKVHFMREYQGFVFLLDERGSIYIFNGMGQLLRTIHSQHPSYFNFIGEELYYPDKNQLALINLFSAEKRTMPVQQPFKIALITDERLFLIHSRAIDFFEFKP